MHITLELPIYYNNDYTSQMEDIGVDTDLSDATIRKQTFFNINGIVEYKDMNNHSLIYSNGQEFICPIDKESVVKLIKDCLQKPAP